MARPGEEPFWLRARRRCRPIAMSSAAVSEIEAMEDRRWAAQIGSDLEALDAILADELRYTHSNGLVDTKASYIKAIDEKVFDYRSESRSDVSTLVIGDTGLATGAIEFNVVAGGRDIDLRARYSAVWVRRAGVWQFLCWQSTPIPS